MVPAGRRPGGRASSSGKRLGPSPAPPQQPRLLPPPRRNCQKLVEPARQRRRGGACGAAAPDAAGLARRAGIASPHRASAGRAGGPPRLYLRCRRLRRPRRFLLVPLREPLPGLCSAASGLRWSRPRAVPRRGSAAWAAWRPFQEAALPRVPRGVGGKLFLPAIK